MSNSILRRGFLASCAFNAGKSGSIVVLQYSSFAQKPDHGGRCLPPSRQQGGLPSLVNRRVVAQLSGFEEVSFVIVPISASFSIISSVSGYRGRPSEDSITSIHSPMVFAAASTR